MTETMPSIELAIRLVSCLILGVFLGIISILIVELVKKVKGYFKKEPKEEYSVLDYGNAEMTLQKYKDRAFEVYRLLDPSERLEEGGYTGCYNCIPYYFKDKAKPDLMVVLTFIDDDEDDESCDTTSREAWFPFELMNTPNIRQLYLDDKITIEWTKKTYTYGGGGCWKMVARLKD